MAHPIEPDWLTSWILGMECLCPILSFLNPIFGLCSIRGFLHRGNPNSRNRGNHYGVQSIICKRQAKGVHNILHFQKVKVSFQKCMVIYCQCPDLLLKQFNALVTNVRWGILSWFAKLCHRILIWKDINVELKKARVIGERLVLGTNWHVCMPNVMHCRSRKCVYNMWDFVHISLFWESIWPLEVSKDRGNFISMWSLD